MYHSRDEALSYFKIHHCTLWWVQICTFLQYIAFLLSESTDQYHQELRVHKICLYLGKHNVPLLYIESESVIVPFYIQKALAHLSYLFMQVHGSS